MNTTNLKFAIFGVGGTGGVIGGYLANAGNDVTFLARGAHLAAMQKDGLTIHTNHRGDIRIKPCKAMLADDYHDTPDVLFICVKYYGLDATIALTRRIAGPDTLVIPILNVFGTGAVMQEKLPVRQVPCLRVPMKNPRLAEDFWGKGRTDMKKPRQAGQ